MSVNGPFYGYEKDLAVLVTKKWMKQMLIKGEDDSRWQRTLHMLSLAQLFCDASPHLGASRHKVILAILILNGKLFNRTFTEDRRRGSLYSLLSVEEGSDKLALEVLEIVRNTKVRRESETGDAETEDPEPTDELMRKHPEIQIVQDVYRIDCMSVRHFGNPLMLGPLHFDMYEPWPGYFQFLQNVEGKMRTVVGQDMVKERMDRVRVYNMWRKEENRMLGLYTYTSA